MSAPLVERQWSVEIAGFGVENTRGLEAGYQDRWAAGSGAAGSWLAIADGIGGGPAGEEAAQAAIGLAQVILGAGESTEAGVCRLFDAAYAALRPWWVRERGGGTTLSAAVINEQGIVVGVVGDSPVYVDFGNGFEQVTEERRSHVLMQWLGSVDRADPWIGHWRWADHDIRGVIVTSDGVDPQSVSSLSADRRAAELAAELLAGPAMGGDDASAVVALLGGRQGS